MEMTEAIGQRLQYFQELESATRMLNHPGESLVLQVDFLYMVERVDLCIEYFKYHVRTLPLDCRSRVHLGANRRISENRICTSCAFSNA